MLQSGLMVATDKYLEIRYTEIKFRMIRCKYRLVVVPTGRVNISICWRKRMESFGKNIFICHAVATEANRIEIIQGSNRRNTISILMRHALRDPNTYILRRLIC